MTRRGPIGAACTRMRAKAKEFDQPRAVIERQIVGVKLVLPQSPAEGSCCSRATFLIIPFWGLGMFEAFVVNVKGSRRVTY